MANRKRSLVILKALTECTRDELSGAPFRNDFTARARNGKETVVSCNAMIFHECDRRLQGVFAAARDITERKCLDRVREARIV